MKAGSRIRGRARLLSVENGAAGVRAVIRYVVEMADEEKPACVAETVRVIVP